MPAQPNAAPVIIKRKKVVAGGGHHGGAWKVAYADFVTAMMAFFLLMWLLNATTEQQRKGLADYFSPTIPVNRVSGGGSGAFGGDSVFSEMTLPKNGTGATAIRSTEDVRARGETGSDPSDSDRAAEDMALRSLEQQLTARGGETMVKENLLEHIVTRVTDEGLVIELFSHDTAKIFADDGLTPTPLLRDLLTLVASVSKSVTNKIAVEGHVRSSPLTLRNNPVWDVSAQRATLARILLQENAVNPVRIQRVTGHADREPVVKDPMASRNDRIEIILLR